jgi:hypothetical protein
LDAPGAVIATTGTPPSSVGSTVRSAAGGFLQLHLVVFHDFTCWIYAIAFCAAFVLIAGIGAVNRHRIDAWLEKQGALNNANAEEHRAQ